MEIVNQKNIISLWFSWYFVEMPKFLFGVWKNYILFASNYFSLPLLLRSLFSPWRKYRWNYTKGFDLGNFFSTLISNIFSRIIGAVMRIALIVVGILFQIFVLIAGLVVILFWVLLPVIIASGLILFLGY